MAIRDEIRTKLCQRDIYTYTDGEYVAGQSSFCAGIVSVSTFTLCGIQNSTYERMLSTVGILHRVKPDYIANVQ